MMELQNISAGYDGKLALNNIDLKVKQGELLVIAGPNGSGKTTLLKCAAGLHNPQQGTVVINGKEIFRLKPREKAALAAILFQTREMPWPFTVRETVMQGCFARSGWLGQTTKADKDAVDAALEKAGLASFAERPITEISGGELQRVYIARCIAQGAAFLLLDEPGNNLDPKYSYKIMSLLSDFANEGRGVIVTLHDLRLASLFAARLALLSHNGQICALGTPSEVLTEENLSRVYDLPPELVRDLVL